MVKANGQPRSLLGWMDSLSDATRLRLLRLTERHELGVAELCDVLQLPQSTVSRHLKVLADQGFVRSRRQGTNHLYRTLVDELQLGARRLWLLAREQTDDWSAVQQDQLRLARRLRQRDTDAQAFFAGAAAEWDKLRRESYGSAFVQDVMLGLMPRDSVVADLGCGTGELSARLAEYVGKVIAVDNSAAMLKAAKKRTEELPNVELHRGELEALPLADSSADAAMMVLVLSYVAEPSLALGEMARVLKPGGRAVVVDLLPHDRDDFRRKMGQSCLGFEVADVQRMLAAAGLTAQAIRPLAPEPGAKGPALFIGIATRAGS